MRHLLWCVVIKLAASFQLSRVVHYSTAQQQLQLRSTALFPTSTLSKIYDHRLFSSLVELSTPGREGADAESDGVTVAINWLNSEQADKLLLSMARSDPELNKEMDKANFWSNGNFVVDGCVCTGIVETGLNLKLHCTVGGKKRERALTVLFPSEVTSEITLKRVLIRMASALGHTREAGRVMQLPFGESAEMPVDLRFNTVPHPTWLRSFLYEQAVNAIVGAVEDPAIPNKSKLQLRINFPEVNPKYDTYRIGTLVELVRCAALALAEDRGLRVRVCVQNSMGEGIFTGLPLAIASMRMILEKMDWGDKLTPAQKYQPGDGEGANTRPEALIRLGGVGPGVLSGDDDVVLVVAPQNIVNGCLTPLLEAMCKEANGRPLVCVNPGLDDKPSGNNVMQIRGRAERRAFADSFATIYQLRLLYPSTGGYMFPIRGLIAKRSYHAPWVVYSKKTEEGGRELYNIKAAFDPYDAPSPATISNIFT